MAAFVVFYWLESALWISLGIFVFGMFNLRARVDDRLAQESRPGQRRHRQRHHHVAALHRGVIAPLIAAKLIPQRRYRFSDDPDHRVPLIVYGSLIGAMRVRASAA